MVALKLQEMTNKLLPKLTCQFIYTTLQSILFSRLGEEQSLHPLLPLHSLIFQRPWHPCRAGGKGAFALARLGAGGGAPLEVAYHPHLPVCHGWAAQAACGAPSRDPEYSAG